MAGSKEVCFVAFNESSIIETKMLIAYMKDCNSIQAIMLGPNPESLFEQLEKLYPEYNYVKQFYSKTSKDLVCKIERYIYNQKQSCSEFSLKVEGTEFQKLVWSELCKIPYGVLTSYADIAKNIGRPSSARAVANACGKNNIPIIIPCHRVVRSDGTLGGYSLGTDIKEKLNMIEKNKIDLTKNNFE